MNTSLRHTAELALIRSIPDLTLGTLPNCRLKGLFKRLQKWVDKDLSNLPLLSENEIWEIKSVIDKFGDSTGWFKNQKHIGTLLSFCAAMIETSEFAYHPRITETINDIIEHLESSNDLPYQSCWAGDIASEKWEALFNNEETA